MKSSSSTDRDMLIPSYFPFAFQISRKARSQPGLSSLLPGEPTPGGILAPSQTRAIVARIQEYEEIKGLSAGFSPGQLLAVNTILQAQRFLLWKYCAADYPKTLSTALSRLETGPASGAARFILPLFVHRFPPVEIVGGKLTDSDFMRESTGTISNRELISSELLLLALTGDNAAMKPLSFLIDDAEFREQREFKTFIDNMDEYFRIGPSMSPLNVTLLERLRAPARSCPDSLEGQLEYIKVNWNFLLPEDILTDLLMSISITKEETRLRQDGPESARVLRFDEMTFAPSSQRKDEEHFSLDADWMANVVLMAKSAYVWLHQLSKEYGIEIRLLSDIPDQALDRLANYGFTGLWLIGLWQRSSASQKIKQMSGNPEAAASAYSLFDYVIADDLGGESAFENLRDRCRQRGIRLAADMVPNHTGIFSKWVIEHPDWFLQLDSPPYPGYQFSGENLSDDSKVKVQIEDGYWDKRDAAVVFKRIDTHSGEVRYLYHGNDGTNMPWNDTAQLDFTLVEVREAVIQTILHVAKHFPIIRFDAAMTLTRKHFRRLWFPAPGEGGAIPSRAECSLTDKEFDALFPHEFWREVVDRIAAEQPDTLLLAEAFWLMEGYFVRTLGMHRVYNSAFMNMLKLEENGKYRATMRNVLEFSPAILGRFVNFMNNPDEETAVEQFGRQDKYFGVATLLVTMPGLPMFGHGQVEGFTEKYGMEYRRAYRDEKSDTNMVSRHERQIFPLLRRRSLFSGWRHFTMYDFSDDAGRVDENVFAYSNGNDNERALVVYNNSYTETSGRIRLSTKINIGSGDNVQLQQRTLVEALGIRADEGVIYRFRDHITGLEFLRTGSELSESGLYAELHAYTCHVFMDFAEVDDKDSWFSRLAKNLNGAGVPSIEKELTALRFEPVLTPFRELLTAMAPLNREKATHRLPDSMTRQTRNFYSAIARQEASDTLPDRVAAISASSLRMVEQLLVLEPETNGKDTRDSTNETKPAEQPASLLALAGWVILRGTGEIASGSEADTNATVAVVLRRYDSWLLADQVSNVWTETEASLIRLLLRYEQFFSPHHSFKLSERLKLLLEDSDVHAFLLVNRFEGALWLNKERFATLVTSLRLAARILEEAADSSVTEDDSTFRPDEAAQILSAAEKAGYRIDRVNELLHFPQ